MADTPDDRISAALRTISFEVASIKVAARQRVEAAEATRDSALLALREIRRRAIFGPGLTTGDLLDLTRCSVSEDVNDDRPDAQ